MAQTADHREVAPDGVLALGHVHHEDDRQQQEDEADDENEQDGRAGEEFQQPVRFVGDFGH